MTEQDYKYEIPDLPDDLKFAKTDRERQYLDYINNLSSQVKKDFLTGFKHKSQFEAEQKDQGIYIFIDGDRLKEINDSMGHAGGTAAILGIRQGILDAVRVSRQESIKISRYGGDEFVIFMENVPLSTGVIVAKRIEQSIRKQNLATFYKGDDPRIKRMLGNWQLTASIGVGKTEQEADQNMYRAKHKGRARVEFTPPKVADVNIEILKFAAKLNQVGKLNLAQKLISSRSKK